MPGSEYYPDASVPQKVLDENARREGWDVDYLDMARWWADRRSKDPSTKVGAVVVTALNAVAGLGYNGFARGVVDDSSRYQNRAVKYPLTVHAEVNAILQAGHEARGATLYCTLYPCADCAGVIINAGIRRLVCPSNYRLAHWSESHDFAETQLEEADIVVNGVTVKWQ